MHPEDLISVFPFFICLIVFFMFLTESSDRKRESDE